MSEDDENVLADFVSVIAEVRFVARELEVDSRVTMPRAPLVIRGLFNTLCIMARVARTCCESRIARRRSFVFDKNHEIGDAIADICRASTADEDKDRGDFHKIRLHHDAAKQSAKKILEKVCGRFGHIRRTVTEDAAQWRPDSDQPDASEFDGCERQKEDMPEP